jgi:dTDP-4-amino-4,6-dideoxygalactose transaminase
MSNKLALFDGPQVRRTPFPPHPVIGEEEKQAVMEVLDSGRLSTFIAVQGEYFNGGKYIKQFEREFAEYHSVEYAVAFNSATAALHAAVVAVGVAPGEEVIVPPYTFTSTATCALMHNAIPVFADIEDDIFCLDPKFVERAITPLTKAIIPVHLFGGPADMDGLLAVARKHNLKVIEDCAQAPGAMYKGKLVGIMGDCGIFSFTENKNITTGEGGMLITNDEAIAEVARQVRNHGEMIDTAMNVRTYNSTMLGWNYRMTEMEAALGIAQFHKMDQLNAVRIELCNYLSRGLCGVDGLRTPVLGAGNKHVYYFYPLKYDEPKMGLQRELFVKALNAEGIPFGAGYVAPLYLTSIYHDRKPFAYQHYKGKARYDKGLCPVSERMHERELILTAVARPPATTSDMDDVLNAVYKIIENRTELMGRMAVGVAQ